VMALAGYDWVVIDRQHGTIGYDAMVEMLRAFSVRGVPSMVRVPWNDPAEIMRALDAGAGGVVVPMVSDSEAAAAAARATRYPPRGFRSWGPIRAGLGDPEYTPAAANDHVVCIPMIETVEAAERSAEIAAVDGVDGLLIGANDLSLSLSHALERPPRHGELVATTLAACARAGIPAGLACGSPEEALQALSDGFRFVSLSSDLGLLSQAATASLEAVRSG
jgi:4-hydroxy-2-oxoheptanedioate aldolase